MELIQHFQLKHMHGPLVQKWMSARHTLERTIFSYDLNNARAACAYPGPRPNIIAFSNHWSRLSNAWPGAQLHVCVVIDSDIGPTSC